MSDVTTTTNTERNTADSESPFSSQLTPTFTVPNPSDPIYDQILPELLEKFARLNYFGDDDPIIQREIVKWAETNRLPLKFFYKVLLERQHTPAFDCLLGFCCQYGIGTLVDELSCFLFYERAANQGNDPFAQNQLGWCYQKGIGVTKDYTKASKMYEMAAEAGDTQGQTNLACCNLYGIGVEEENQEVAFHWFKKSAELGNANAQCWLGCCYSEGTGCNKDKRKSFLWQARSAFAGHAPGKRQLGMCYIEGVGTEKDMHEGLKWCRRAYINKDDYAYAELRALFG